MAPVIAIMTDFGLKDGYAASMKGVILTLCPKARLVDITHLVPPQSVRAGAFILAGLYRDFPPGTIYLAVVDPGVGTGRKALAIRTTGYYLVGPDNGLFSGVLDMEKESWEARSLENREYWRPAVSSTFHGRDIFAPVAAHLARGTPFELLGPVCSPVAPGWNPVRQTGGSLEGEIIHIDHFGNGITNITREKLEVFAPPGRRTVHAGGRTISTVADTYGLEEPGSPLALIGSSGQLEIAVNRGSAADLLGIRPGDPIIVRRSKSRSKPP